MRILFIAGLSCLVLAACTREPLPSTGSIPAAVFANDNVGEDPAIAAVSIAEEAFVHPGTVRGRPGEMALAIACLDEMAGQLTTSGRWTYVDTVTKYQMLIARDKVRGIVGIRKDADSQRVIDHMLEASAALKHGDEAEAKAALTGPIFTTPYWKILAMLSDFPYVAEADVALLNADRGLLSGGGGPNDQGHD